MGSELKLLIRADAGPSVGTGHVMRSLALGQHWQSLGGKVTFVCGQLPAGLVRRIETESFQLYQIQNQNCDAADARDLSEIASIVEPHWILLDGYRFDDQYQESVSRAANRLAVLDDWGHASHQHADLVINQNAYADSNSYPATSPANLLCGPRFTLLRQEFENATPEPRTTPSEARRILVTFGGADPNNWTLQTLKLLSELNRKNLVVDCVVGASYTHVRELEQFKKTAKMNLRCHRNVDRMSILMERVDFAITAGGSTCYELARCGVPAVVVSIADNQVPVAEAMDQLGIMHSIGNTGIGDQPHERKAHLAKAIRRLLNDPKQRQSMSKTGMRLVDGKGAQRIAQKMASSIYPLRNVTLNDAGQLLRWRNDPEVRSVSFQTSVVTMETHIRWLTKRIADPSSRLWLIENPSQKPVGLIRFEDDEQDNAVISIVLDETFRGRGLGRVLISLAVEKLFEASNAESILAQIKPGNVASERAFKAAGFLPIGPVIIDGQMALQYSKNRSRPSIEFAPVTRQQKSA